MFHSILQKSLAHKRELAVVILIIAVGIFLRAYHFSDWLHFEIDQSYDTLLVSPAVEHGISNLPLLGPTAGGGRALRLGPAYYYLEYLSTTLFGNTPPGHAAFVLLFAIFSLPLFYLLCRKYFSRSVALGLLAIFAVSPYLVLYSRFSWSPNVLPFLVILSFYALLKSVSPEEAKKDFWFVVTSATIAIITQIHFNAFFIVPPVVLVFLIIKRPVFKWQTWLATVGIFLALYSPVIISDIKNNGQNLHYFTEKLAGGTTSHSSFSQKLIQIIQYHASNYFLITTGIDHINGNKLVDDGFQSAKTRPWRIAAILLLLAELIILGNNFFREKDRARKDFLLLISLWFAVSFFYLFSVAKSGLNIYPRFFLLMAPLAIILLGFILEKIKPEKNARRQVFFLVLILGLLFSNLSVVKTYFSQLSQAQTEPVSVQTEDVFPNTARVTLAQQYAIVDFMESKSKLNHYPIYLRAKHEYEPIFWYHLEKRGIPFEEAIKDDVTYQEGNYFLITFPAKKELESFLPRFTVAEKKDFGALVVYYLTPKPASITAIKQTALPEIPIQISQKTIQIMHLLIMK